MCLVATCQSLSYKVAAPTSLCIRRLSSACRLVGSFWDISLSENGISLSAICEDLRPQHSREIGSVPVQQRPRCERSATVFNSREWPAGRLRLSSGKSSQRVCVCVLTTRGYTITLNNDRLYIYTSYANKRLHLTSSQSFKHVLQSYIIVKVCNFID